MAAVLLLAGCGGAKAKPAAGSCVFPATVDPDGFVAAFATALCCRSGRCAPYTEEALAFCESSPDPIVSAIAAGIDAGTLTIDAAHATACLQALAGDACAANGWLPPECRAALVGQPIGGACLSPYDCAQGTCVLSATSCFGICTTGANCEPSCSAWEACADNQCQPGASAGEACLQPSGCAFGLVCGPRICVAPGSAGTACTEDDECLPGTFCASGAPGLRVCAAQLGIGTFCGDQNSSMACGFGSYCSNQGVVGDGGMCTAYGNVGDPCQPQVNAAVAPTCLIGLYCEGNGRVEGVCSLLPTSGQCVDDGQAPCAPGDYCDGNHQCQVLRGIGEPCDDGGYPFGCASGQCNSAFVCAAPSSICQ